MSLLKQPLTNSRNDEIILYDRAALMEVAPHIAEGYVALLQPARAGPQKKDRENAYLLAFMALTEGNVVDACFGVSNYHQSSADGDHKAAAFVRKAKHLIAQAADTSDSVQTLAVDTYRKAFQTLIETHTQKQKVFFLFRCFVSKRIQRRGLSTIQKSFRRLEEAIQSST